MVGDVKMVETLDPTFPHRHTETTINEQIPFVRSPEPSWEVSTPWASMKLVTSKPVGKYTLTIIPILGTVPYDRSWVIICYL